MTTAIRQKAAAAANNPRNLQPQRSALETPLVHSACRSNEFGVCLLSGRPRAAKWPAEIGNFKGRQLQH
jgi:hypothetical protein